MRRLWISILVSACPQLAAAQSLPFDLSQYSNDYLNLITSEYADPVIALIGLGMEHRGYEPATALGNVVGLSTGIELTFVKIPESFKTAIKKVGYQEDLPIQSVPLPRLQLHKGIGTKAAIGASLIKYKDYFIWGGDFQYTFYQPEEGPIFAARVGYTNTDVSYVKSKTYSLAAVMSKDMPWADPYMGIGYHWSHGSIELPIRDGIDPNDYPPEVQAQLDGLAVKGTGRARGYNGFLGVLWRFRDLGLQLALEGSYAQAGTHTLGAKVGLRF